MDIRLATTTDAAAMIAFDHVASADPRRAQLIHDQIKCSACHVAVLDAQPVGYGILNYKFYDNGWIELLYVDAQYRRQGIGTALLRRLIETCSTPKLFTSTNQSNLPMRQLLDRLGFERSGHIENLDEDDPELVYLKRRSESISQRP